MTCARRFRRVTTSPATRDRSTIASVAAHNADVARAPFDASWTLRADISVAFEVTHQLSARLGIITENFLSLSICKVRNRTTTPAASPRSPQSGAPRLKLYRTIAAEYPSRVVMLCDRARVLARSDRLAMPD